MTNSQGRITMSSNLAGPKILLIGPSGSGKTHSLATAVEWALANNMNVAALFTESGIETLLGYWKDAKKPVPPNLYYHSTLTKPLGLKDLMTAADSVGKMSYESITKMTDPNRGQNNYFYKILGACSNFKDERTGKELGPIENLDESWIFILDSLTELANACMKMVIGNKPTASMPDYGVAQNNLMNFLRLITQGLRCSVIMTGHVSREKDEITGGTKLSVRSIGSALSPDIPPLFSEVILTVREGSTFTWDTAAFGADLKTRSLGYRSKIAPDFSQIFNVWKQRATA